MSELQDLVLGSLPDVEDSLEVESTFEPRPPLEALNLAERTSYDELLQLCSIFRQEAPEHPEKIPYRLAQFFVYLEKSPIPTYSFVPGKKTLATYSLAATCAADPSPEKLSEMLEWVEQTEQAVQDHLFAAERNKVICDIVDQIDFLADFFGEDIVQELAELGDVRPATARKWIAGSSSPTWSNSQKVQLLARTFYAARHRAEMSNEEALAWYREGRPGEDSPRDLLHRYGGSYISEELRSALEEVGCRGEY